MFASLDKAKQDQLLADPSNPNPTPSVTSISSPSKPPIKDSVAKPSAHKAEPKITGEPEEVSTSSHVKPTLKEIKAALKKAQNVESKPADEPSRNEMSTAKEPSQNGALAAKTGSISAAPLRRKKMAQKAASQSQQKVPEIDKLNTRAQNEAPEIELADVKNAETEATNAKRVTSDASDATIIAPLPVVAPPPDVEPQPVIPGSAEYHEIAKTYAGEVEKRKRWRSRSFFAQAELQLKSRDIGCGDFRVLQARLENDLEMPVWGGLIEPLCEFLEKPKWPRASDPENLKWEDIQFHALSTLRMLMLNPLWAADHYPRIVMALTNMNSWYKGNAHMVSGIRKGLDFVINHCNVLECLALLCHRHKVAFTETKDELELLALGAMLHHIHTHPEQESQFYHLLGSEAEMVNRLAKIGTTGMQSEVASIRKAAIGYAQEFWHLASRDLDVYVDLLAGGDLKTQRLLRYYLLRHEQIDDHVEL